MTSALGPFTLILLLAPAIALKIAVRVLYGRRRLAVADPLQMFLSLAGTLMLALALLGVIMGLTVISFSPVVILCVVLPILIGLIILALMVLDRVRHAEHRAIVWSLAAAAERGVPLAE